MGQSFAYQKAPPTPERLWEEVDRLHREGRIFDLCLLLDASADKAKGGGVFAHSLYGIEVDWEGADDDVSPWGSTTKHDSPGSSVGPTSSPKSSQGHGLLPRTSAAGGPRVDVRRVSRSMSFKGSLKRQVTEDMEDEEEDETEREIALGLRAEGSGEDPEAEERKKIKRAAATAKAEAAAGMQGAVRQQISPSLQRVASRLCNCTHIECKMAFLLFSEAAGSPRAFNMAQRIANQEAMAEWTSKAICTAFDLCKKTVACDSLTAAMAVVVARPQNRDSKRQFCLSLRDLKRDHAHRICQTARMYARCYQFREDFLGRGGHELLLALARPTPPRRPMPHLRTKVTQRTSKDPALLVPVLSACRTIVEYEVVTVDVAVAQGQARRDVPLARQVINAGFPTLLYDALHSPRRDPTIIAEVCAGVCWVMRIIGVEPCAPCAASILKILKADGVYRLEGAGGEKESVGPTGMVLGMKTLCFMVRMDDRVLEQMMNQNIVSACRRLIVTHDCYSAATWYSILTLERVAGRLAVVDLDDRARPDEAARFQDMFMLVLDCLASAMRRLVTLIVRKDDALTDCLGKICWMLCIMSKLPRQRTLTLCHGIVNIMAREILKKVDYPDWIMVPCIEVIGSMVGFEAQAMFLSKQLARKLSVPIYKLSDTIVPLCRIVELCGRGTQWQNARLAEACFSVLLRLTTEHAMHENNASIAFEILEMSEIWKWEEARKHLKQERQRRVVKNRVKKGKLENEDMEAEVEEMRLKEMDDYSAHRQQRVEKVLQKWDELHLDFPECLNITWECNWFESQCDIDDSITSASKLAHIFRLSLEEHQGIAQYVAAVGHRAKRLQKWWRRHVAMKRLREATIGRYKNQQAALLIQTRWRGHKARQEHDEALASEATRRVKATFIQRKWRGYQQGRVKELRCLFNFVSDKLGRERVDLDELDFNDGLIPGMKRRSNIVEIEGNEAFYEIAMNEDEDKKANVLVFFYSHFEIGSRRVMQQYEKLAWYFSEEEGVVIARCNGEDNPSLRKKFGIVAYPGLIWITEDNEVKEYDAEWPKKPMTITQMVENFVAIEIQRSWRGIRVRKAFLKLMERVREQVRMVRKKNMRLACEAGDQELLGRVLEEADPNDLTDTGEIPLNIAVRKCNKETFATLVRAGADVNQEDEHGHTPAFYAAAAGMNEVMRLLIKQGAEVHHTGRNGKNLLHVSCEVGSEGIALLLLNSGLEKECYARDNTRHTPLDYALVTAMESVAIRLMLKGVTVHRKMEDKMLFHALIKRMSSVSRLIIAQGLVDLTKHDQTEQEWTALHYAAAMGNYSALAALLDKGVDPMSLTRQKLTPLHLAAKNGHEMCCDMLLSCMGAALRVTPETLLDTYYDHEGRMQGPFVDADGNTVLHYACSQPALAGFAEKMLRDLERSVPGRNYCGNTPLHFAASKGMYFVAANLANRMLAQGMTDELNENGNSALHLAVIYGHRDIVCMLLDLDLQAMDITDPTGNTLLHFACAGQGEDAQAVMNMVETLMNEYDHPPNVMNDKKLTPLHLAASEGNVQLTDMLIRSTLIETEEERIVFANAPDEEGNTALHYACRRSPFETDPLSPNFMNEQTIQVLIVEGADATLENNNGQTPRELLEDQSLIDRAVKLREKRVERAQVEDYM
eukprot:Hpha_TRINITY_DN4101_c0_g1::TRINITY_DN4101_c0_g1_i1::g.194804::m.194804/K10380/ANK; ankyrin